MFGPDLCEVSWSGIWTHSFFCWLTVGGLLAHSGDSTSWWGSHRSQVLRQLNVQHLWSGREKDECGCSVPCLFSIQSWTAPPHETVPIIVVGGSHLNESSLKSLPRQFLMTINISIARIRQVHLLFRFVHLFSEENVRQEDLSLFSFSLTDTYRVWLRGDTLNSKR